MNCLFEVITPYDQETVRHYTTYFYRHKGRSWPIVFIALGLFLLGIAFWEFRKGSRILGSVAALLGFGLAGSGILFLSGKSSVQVPKTPDGQPVVCRMRFYEDRVELAGPQSNAFYRYDQLSAPGMDTLSLYVYTDTGEGLIMRKDGFTLGTPEGLWNFLRGKINK